MSSSVFDPNIIFSKTTVKSLCLTKYHVMKTYWKVEVQLHAFLT